MTAARRVLLACSVAVASSAVGLAAMVVAAEVARPTPKPCRDTFIVEARAAAMCAAPEAIPIVVIGSGVVAAVIVFAAAAVVRSAVLRRGRRGGALEV